MKRILITGQDSYIGTSVENWLMREPDKYSVHTIDMRDGSWKNHDFSQYDVVFHVAGIVHKKEKPEMESLYYSVNRDLPFAVAKMAKDSGVAQFIFMSTMAVYGEDGKIGENVVITPYTPVSPRTYYGKSKAEAENKLKKLESDDFTLSILRPPMVYGKDCPGNYARLEKLAKKIPVFPLIDNQRSMVHIDTLCIYIKKIVEESIGGILFLQDDKYVNTSLLVKELAVRNGKKIYLSKFAGQVIKVFGRKITFLNKIFGNLVYEKL